MSKFTISEAYYIVVLPGGVLALYGEGDAEELLALKKNQVPGSIMIRGHKSGYMTVTSRESDEQA